MKIVKQWLPEIDNIGWRVVTDEQAEQLAPMIKPIYTVPQFILHLQRQGCFVITKVPGSVVRDPIETISVITVSSEGVAVVSYEHRS